MSTAGIVLIVVAAIFGILVIGAIAEIFTAVGGLLKLFKVAHCHRGFCGYTACDFPPHRELVGCNPSKES
ncbi:hypothetical protein [Helicobacter ailurogastricus]|uniref:hypothetical protein n=1 Tax=Helicobacter ailurogastricus TaxID=1578720 RepID=UPI0025566124|nr:hypothetical protein [Helicobacter ailurogastricus]